MLHHKMISCVSFSILISFFIFSPNVIAQSKINDPTVKNNKQNPLAPSKIRSTTIQKKQVSGIIKETIKEKPLTTSKAKTTTIPKKQVTGVIKKRIGKKPLTTSKIRSTAISKKKVTGTLELSRKISMLNKELSKTKSALSLEKKTRASRDEQVNKLTADLKTITYQIGQKEAELIKLKDAYEEAKTMNLLYDEIKTLEALLTERDTELINLKDTYEKSNAIVLSNVIACYREAFDVWNKMHRIREDMDKEESQQGFLIISAELRKAINSCPPI